MGNIENLKIIARMRSDFPAKFGIPRQSGMVTELRSTVVFEPGYRQPEALRGLDGFSHIWLIWGFSAAANAGWSPTVRPPRLEGNTRMGVFATRSPFRPNSLGLSCVRMLGIEPARELGPVIHVSGADLMDGSPIYDVKPYVPYSDAHPDALSGFVENHGNAVLAVDFPPALLAAVPEAKKVALLGVLSQDPRPSYQNAPGRVYGMAFAGLEIKFRVKNDLLTVLDVSKSR